MPFTTPEVTAPIDPPVPVRAAVPFSAGAVIGRSFRVWFRNLAPFTVVTVVLHLPVFALAALAPREGGAAWGVLDRVLSGLVALVTAGALTHGVLTSLRGGRAGVGELLGSGFGNLGAIFAVSFRVGLWLFLGAILLLVPAIVWYCGLFVAVPAVVVERGLGSSSDALERSRKLTKGHRWAIFGVILVVWLVTLGVAFLGGLGSALLAPVAPHPWPTLAVVAVLAMLGTFGATAPAVAYHDLRVAKEGVSAAELMKVFE